MTPLQARSRQRTTSVAPFSLTEFLVAAAVIVTLAAFVSTQVLRAWISTHEELGLTSLRQIAKACQLYFVTSQQFPDDLRQLALPLANPPYLDQGYVGDGTSAIRQGYRFTYAAPNPDQFGKAGTFRLLADPLPGRTNGKRHFYVDQTLVVRETLDERCATALDSRVH